MDLKVIRNLRNMGTLLVFIIGFVLWFMLPEQVPIHFSQSGPDDFGNKIILLLIFVLPLFGLVPWQRDKVEIHDTSVTDEMKKLLDEDEDRKKEIYQSITASVVCAVFLLILICVKNAM